MADVTRNGEESAGELVQPSASGKSVVLDAQTVDKLLTRGNADAALLYLAVLCAQGNTGSRELARTLHWEMERVRAAETVLREMSLLCTESVSVPSAVPVESVSAPSAVPMESMEERPVYRQMEIYEQLDQNPDFRILTQEVEKRLGKKLSLRDMETLMGLYDYAGLPAHVIYQLVGHCEEKNVEKYGKRRPPSMRQIEKEGYAWARMGLDTQEAAAEYLRRYAQQQHCFSAYMRALNMGGRTPVDSEREFLTKWETWNFSPEMIALAYDRTVLNCHKFQWKYCHAILRRWHDAGYRTPADVENKDHAAPQNRFSDYMRVLNMGGRLPVGDEKEFLMEWETWNFSPEMIALAYDRTVLNCHKFQWKYCTAILKRWHDAGYRTPEDVKNKDRASPRRGMSSADSDAAWKAEIREYMQD